MYIADRQRRTLAATQPSTDGGTCAAGGARRRPVGAEILHRKP